MQSSYEELGQKIEVRPIHLHSLQHKNRFLNGVSKPVKTEVFDHPNSNTKMGLGMDAIVHHSA